MKGKELSRWTLLPFQMAALFAWSVLILGYLLAPMALALALVYVVSQLLRVIS